jgi:nucleoside-diphosphate-sugar epimerase
MHILITGANGFIGNHLLLDLLQMGHEVTGCVRNPQAASIRWPEARFIHADFSRDLAIADWLPRLHGVDLLINAVGIIREHGTQRFDRLHRDAPIALFRACAVAGVRRVIQISALGADETAFSQYHLSKKAADDLLAKLDLDWTILMPSIVYGPGAKSMAFFAAMACLPATPLVDLGEQPVQPVHISDLIRVIRHTIFAGTAFRQRVEIVGPYPISMRALFEKLRHWLGFGAPRFFSISYDTTCRIAHLAGFLGGTPVNSEAVAMLRRGNTADVSRFEETFGFLPKSLDHTLASVPARDADRWHAGLYFIRPLLGLSIAFVWIFTGIISAFVIPAELSYGLLAKADITGVWAPIMLYGAATTDLLLGFAILARARPGLTGAVQILLILVYTLIISLSQPEQWLHPFGPVTKNVPMIVAILSMMALERRA